MSDFVSGKGVKTKKGSTVKARSSRIRHDGDDTTLSIHGYAGTTHRIPDKHRRNEEGWVSLDLRRPGMEIWAGLTIADAEQLVGDLQAAIQKAKERPACEERCYWCAPPRAKESP